MPSPADLAERLLVEVSRLVPEYARDPVDAQISGGGNAAFAVIDPTGEVRGKIFGNDPGKKRFCFGIVTRKVLQVWATGYATGRFEELVFTGKLDESAFGLSRPDFVGWMGGVALETDEGSLVAAAFSGFRGEKDVEIVERAAANVPGLRVRRG
jgi:uncharacterized protein GlcG (DUF336 family)